MLNPLAPLKSSLVKTVDNSSTMQSSSLTAVAGQTSNVHPLHNNIQSNYHSSQSTSTLVQTATTPISGPPHFVDLHVNPGESVSLQFFDGNETILQGPTTIKMVSNSAFPPMALPVQVPPGHMIQQIVDENGTLRHIVLSALAANGAGQTLGSTGYQNTVVQHSTAQSTPFCCCCLSPCPAIGPAATLTTSKQPVQTSTHSSPSVATSISHVPGGNNNMTTSVTSIGLQSSPLQAATLLNSSPIFVPSQHYPQRKQQSSARSARNLFVQNSAANTLTTQSTNNSNNNNMNGGIVQQQSKRSNTYSAGGYHGASSGNIKPSSNRYSKTHENVCVKNNVVHRYGMNDHGRTYSDATGSKHLKNHHQGDGNFYASLNPYYSPVVTTHTNATHTTPTISSDTIPSYGRDFIIPKISIIDPSSSYATSTSQKSLINGHCVSSATVGASPSNTNNRLNGIKSADIKIKNKKTKDFTGQRTNNNNINNNNSIVAPHYHHLTNEPKSCSLYSNNNNNNNNLVTCNNNNIGHDQLKQQHQYSFQNRVALVNSDTAVMKNGNLHTSYPEYHSVTLLTKQNVHHNSQLNVDNKTPASGLLKSHIISQQLKLQEQPLAEQTQKQQQPPQERQQQNPTKICQATNETNDKNDQILVKYSQNNVQKGDSTKKDYETENDTKISDIYSSECFPKEISKYKITNFKNENISLDILSLKESSNDVLEIFPEMENIHENESFEKVDAQIHKQQHHHHHDEKIEQPLFKAASNDKICQVQNDDDDDDDDEFMKMEHQNVQEFNNDKAVDAISEKKKDNSDMSSALNERNKVDSLNPTLVSNSSGTTTLPASERHHLLPKIEAIVLTQTMTTHNTCKLKWFPKAGAELNNSSTIVGSTCNNSETLNRLQKRHFVVESILSNMDVDDASDQQQENYPARIVFQGHAQSCRVNQLQPSHEYMFRVRSSNETSILISNILTIVTSEAPINGNSLKLSSGKRSKHSLQQQVIQQQQQILQQQQQLLLQERQIATVSASNAKSQLSIVRNIIGHWYINPDQRFALVILVCFALVSLFTAVAIQNYYSSTLT